VWGGTGQAELLGKTLLRIPRRGECSSAKHYPRPGKKKTNKKSACEPKSLARRPTWVHPSRKKRTGPRADAPQPLRERGGGGKRGPTKLGPPEVRTAKKNKKKTKPSRHSESSPMRPGAMEKGGKRGKVPASKKARLQEKGGDLASFRNRGPRFPMFKKKEPRMSTFSPAGKGTPHANQREKTLFFRCAGPKKGEGTLKAIGG